MFYGWISKRKWYCGHRAHGVSHTCLKKCLGRCPYTLPAFQVLLHLPLGNPTFDSFLHLCVWYHTHRATGRHSESIAEGHWSLLLGQQVMREREFPAEWNTTEGQRHHLLRQFMHEGKLPANCVCMCVCARTRQVSYCFLSHTLAHTHNLKTTPKQPHTVHLYCALFITSTGYNYVSQQHKVRCSKEACLWQVSLLALSPSSLTTTHPSHATITTCTITHGNFLWCG